MVSFNFNLVHILFAGKENIKEIGIFQKKFVPQFYNYRRFTVSCMLQPSLNFENKYSASEFIDGIRIDEMGTQFRDGKCLNLILSQNSPVHDLAHNPRHTCTRSEVRPRQQGCHPWSGPRSWTRGARLPLRSTPSWIGSRKKGITRDPPKRTELNFQMHDMTNKNH